MNRLLEKPVRASARTAVRVPLRVQRTGIRFRNIAPDRVAVAVEVENTSDEPSRATEMRLEAAPFGAFVAWRPLVTLAVPPLPPRGRTEVLTVAEQPRPRALVTATDIVQTATAQRSRLAILRRRVQPLLASWLDLARAPRGLPGLPADLSDLLGNAQPHWAGNLNVWVGGKAVERHMAPRLRLHPGRANLTIFDVGGGPDAYAFRPELPSRWESALHDVTGGCERVQWSYEDEEVWHSFGSMRFLLFVARPPVRCGPGVARVHVTQRSSGRTAQVEFDFDPDADGPGCWVE